MAKMNEKMKVYGLLRIKKDRYGDNKRTVMYMGDKEYVQSVLKTLVPEDKIEWSYSDGGWADNGYGEIFSVVFMGYFNGETELEVR